MGGGNPGGGCGLSINGKQTIYIQEESARERALCQLTECF